MRLHTTAAFTAAAEKREGLSTSHRFCVVIELRTNHQGKLGEIFRVAPISVDTIGRKVLHLKCLDVIVITVA